MSSRIFTRLHAIFRSMLGILVVTGTAIAGDSISPGAIYTITAEFSGKALDIVGSSTTPGTFVQQSTLTGSLNQQWQFISDGNGHYQIRSILSGLNLDVSGASTSDGAQVLTWPSNGGLNQLWTVSPIGNGYYQILSVNSGLSLDVTGINPNDGVKIEQWDINNGGNQQWSLNMMPPPQSTLSSGSIYTITAPFSAKALAVANFGVADGTQVTQWDPSGNTDQQWRVDIQPNGYYVITSILSGKVLDIASASMADGAEAVTTSANGSTSQMWSIIPMDANQFQLINAASGKSLDVAGLNTGDGAYVEQWQINGGSNQRWSFTLAQSSPPAAANGTGLFGSYYANNTLFQGNPVTQIDPILDYSGNGSYIIPNLGDSFSTIWTGFIETRYNESYTLIITADDGVNVALDGVTIINNPTWISNPVNSYSFQGVAGALHSIQINYNQAGGPGQILMQWQSAHEGLSVVPSICLYPVNPSARTPQSSLTARVPQHTYVSPACIEGSFANALPSILVNDLPAPSLTLGGTLWYANVPLLTATTNAVSIQEGTTTLDQIITWDVMDVDGLTINTLSARVSDSIAVMSSLGGSINITHPDGTLTTLAPNVVTQYVTLTSAGQWTISNASNSSSISIAVFDGSFAVDPAHPLSIEQNGVYAIDLSSYTELQPNASSLVFVSQDPELSVQQSGSQLQITGYNIGSRYGSVRIGSTTGPILAPLPTTCFAISGWGSQTYVMPDGSPIPNDYVGGPDLIQFTDAANNSRFVSTLTITPYVPNVTITITKFAHPTTFIGGATTFTIATDGSPSSLGENGFAVSTVNGVQVGTFSFTMISPPDAPGTYCLMKSDSTSASFINNSQTYPIPVVSLGIR